MFFPERIRSIRNQDRVLEIGPGATPFHRADIFLEKIFETESELIAQSGHVGVLKTDKKIVYYSGDSFPFKDKEFDYVICSHVLEHVEDVETFLSEIMRVGKRGYLEFPTIYYDYLHNIEEHLNILFYKDKKILWCKKTETPIPELKAFTDFFRTAQVKGYRMQPEINAAWHQGFEWENTITNNRVSDWKQLCYTVDELKTIITSPRKINTDKTGIIYSLKLLLRSVLIKLGLKKG